MGVKIASISSDKEEKSKFTRSERPAYAALQILDEIGEPMNISKDRIKVIKGSKDAGVILDVLDSNEHKNVTYIKVPLAA